MKNICIAIIGSLVLSFFAGSFALAQDGSATTTDETTATTTPETMPEPVALEPTAQEETIDPAVLDQLAQQIEALVQEIARLQVQIVAFLNTQPATPMQAQTESQFQGEVQAESQVDTQGGATVQQDITMQGDIDTVVEPNLAGVRFERELSQGMEGDDVWLLQEILATDSAIYPEGLTTGYYGQLTHEAVVRFQERFGIDPASGNVDAATMAVLNNLVDEKIGDSGQVSPDILGQTEGQQEEQMQQPAEDMPEEDAPEDGNDNDFIPEL